MAFCDADLNRMCASDGLGKIACDEKNEFKWKHSQIFAAYPDKFKVGTPTYDKCAVDLFQCLLDPEWKFCKSFPEFCRIPKNSLGPVDRLGEFICEADPELFCGGTKDKVTSAAVICDNFSQLSLSVREYSSMRNFCKADPKAICAQPKYVQAGVCNDEGNFVMNKETACTLYPEKCKFGSDTFDHCAISLGDCIVDRSWDFCSSFPEMCTNHVTHHYKNTDQLLKAICESDKKLFCNGTDTEVVSQEVVCKNFDLLSEDLRKKTGLEKFCNGRPWEVVCESP